MLIGLEDIGFGDGFVLGLLILSVAMVFGPNGFSLKGDDGTYIVLVTDGVVDIPDIDVE